MSLPEGLPRDFYCRNTVEVAHDLLGMRLVRLEGGSRIGGMIIETEAYRGEEDLACHARAGRTPRTQVLYGEPGHAYVYFTYGMHWMLNLVTEPANYPAAVLIRAIFPLEGLAQIEARRNGQPPAHWTDGPGKICQALGIDGRQHGEDICTPTSDILVEHGVAIAEEGIVVSPRIGLNNVPEPWRSKPWRFRVSDDHVDGLISWRFNKSNGEVEL